MLWMISETIPFFTCVKFLSRNTNHCMTLTSPMFLEPQNTLPFPKT